MITRNRIATMMFAVLTMASWNAADASQKMGAPSSVGINGKVLGTCGQPGCLLVVVHSHRQAHTTQPAVNAKPSPRKTYRKRKMGGSSSVGINGKVLGTCGQPGCLLVVVHSHRQAHTSQPAVNAKPSPRKTYRKTKMGGSSSVGINGKVLGTCGQPGCLLVVVHSHRQAHTTQPAVNAKPSPRKTYRKTKMGGSSVIKMNGHVTTRTPAKAKVSVKRSYRKTKKGD